MYSEGGEEMNPGNDADRDGVASSGNGQLAAGETAESIRGSISSEFGLKLSEWSRRSLDSLLDNEV